MKISFKLPRGLLSRIQKDLHRHHPFAYERVGFITFRAAHAGEDLLILAYGYESIPDEEYVRSKSVGAMMGPEAIHRGMNLAFNHGEENVSVFHVHHHSGRGVPYFSGTDTRETAKFVPDFFHAASGMPHGALILSDDRATGRIWTSEDVGPHPFDKIICTGDRMEFLHLP